MPNAMDETVAMRLIGTSCLSLVHALSKERYPGKRMNSNILTGLTNIGFWNCRGTQDWGLDAHRNEGLEIVYLETGGWASRWTDGPTPCRLEI